MAMVRSGSGEKRRGRAPRGNLSFFRMMLAGVAAILLFAGGSFAAEVLPLYTHGAWGMAGTQSERAAEAQGQDAAWNLILVNRSHAIPADYQPELMRLANGEQVDARIYPELQVMFDAARADGVYPFVAAGYRTEEKQQRLLDDKIMEYRLQGHSAAKARSLAEEWVAVPGTSEHQLGLAVDINADPEKSDSDAVYAWLAAHGSRYGFILRYPADKADITGIRYEPWHFRYVGREAAQEMTRLSLCLEEYLERNG